MRQNSELNEKTFFFFLAADPSDPDERAARPEALKCVTGSDDRSVDKSHASFFSISILYLPQNHLKKKKKKDLTKCELKARINSFCDR